MVMVVVGVCGWGLVWVVGGWDGSGGVLMVMVLILVGVVGGLVG
jgi:hypothetical protein